MSRVKIKFRLQDALNVRDMSRADLVLMSGLTRQTVDKLCNDPKSIRFATIEKLCYALCCAPGSLIVVDEDD